MRRRSVCAVGGVLTMVLGAGCSQALPDPQEVDAGHGAPCPTEGVVLDVNPGANALIPVALVKDCPLPVVFQGAGIWSVPTGTLFLGGSGSHCRTGTIYPAAGGEVLLDGGAFVGMQQFVVVSQRDADGGISRVSGTLSAGATGTQIMSGSGYTMRTAETQALTSGVTYTEYAPGFSQLVYRVPAAVGTLDVTVKADGQEVTVSASIPGGAGASGSGFGQAQLSLAVAQQGEVTLLVGAPGANCSSGPTVTIDAPDFEALPASYRRAVEITATQR